MKYQPKRATSFSLAGFIHGRKSPGTNITISIPAFGAGIPENKGTKVWIKDGMIYMGNINQVFHEFTWINSHFATRDIKLNGQLIARGATLPEHTRVNLAIVKRRYFDGREKHQ